jgi:NitT/TauT family transport system substrate-binding protein
MEFATSLPTFQMAAKKVGKTLGTHYYSDWGLDIYSAGLTTTEALIAKRPDLVRKFTQATIKAFAFAVENPKKAVDAYMKHFPEQNRINVAGAWDITVDRLFDKTAEKHGIGYISKEKMTFTRDLLTNYQKIPVKVPVEDICTNEYLPKVFPKRP